MSTRSCIVRLENRDQIKFTGAYHHWDGSPETLGAHLWHCLHNKHNTRDTAGKVFEGEPGKDALEAFLANLIDEHPAGWSTIIPSDPEFQKDGDDGGPKCYCHPESWEPGREAEKAWVVTQDDASGSGCEWAYAFDVEAGKMLVLCSYCEDGDKMIGAFGCDDPKGTWRAMAEIDIADPNEPDWDAIAKAAYANAEGEDEG